jgi:hypothetical protein
MKIHLINSIKPILVDRLVAALIIVFVLACLAYCVYVGVSLRPSDLQVAVHYSAYGETSFYRDKWYYLITFIVFGLLLAVIHTILIAKIYLQGHRHLALAFAWLSLLLVVIAWFMTWAIMKVAFL